jgi:hypothetical protein
MSDDPNNSDHKGWGNATANHPPPGDKREAKQFQHGVDHLRLQFIITWNSTPQCA